MREPTRNAVKTSIVPTILKTIPLAALSTCSILITVLNTALWKGDSGWGKLLPCLWQIDHGHFLIIGAMSDSTRCGWRKAKPCDRGRQNNSGHHRHDSDFRSLTRHVHPALALGGAIFRLLWFLRICLLRPYSTPFMAVVATLLHLLRVDHWA